MENKIYTKSKVEMLVHDFLEKNNIFVERNGRDEFASEVALEVSCEIEDEGPVSLSRGEFFS